MSIVLRVNKGSALTYDEMDRNQSQFYFSSSLHQDGSQLRLHYTGSVALADGGVDYSPRYDTVPISTGDIEIPQATAAGNTNEIQFNFGGTFAADNLFTFLKDKNYLGIGTAIPDGRLHIVADQQNGAETVLQARSTSEGITNAVSKNASIHIKEGSSTVGKVGRTKTDGENYDLFVQNEYIIDTAQKKYGKIRFAIKGTTGNEHTTLGTFSFDNNAARLGVGLNAINPARTVSVVGTEGVGFSKTTNYSLASYISPIPVFATGGGLGAVVSNLPSLQPVGSNKNVGLLISSPNINEGGNIIAAINTDAFQKEAFSIVKSINNTDGKFAGTSSVIASFQASGKVGINTNTASDVGLTVDGIISGSGNLNVEGTATVESLDTGSAANTSALVATSTGLIQKIAAAPVPVGGIIMWSGAPNAIPSGWNLCDDSGEVNGVTVPDLRNKFVVAANSTGATATTDIEGSDNTTGGSNSHRHGDGAWDLVTDLKSVNYTIPKNGYTIASGNNSPEDLRVDGYNVLTENANEAGEYLESIAYQSQDRSLTSGTHSHKVDVPFASNIPTYYALAFIIYVGV